jgi:hypothetical protein
MVEEWYRRFEGKWKCTRKEERRSRCRRGQSRLKLDVNTHRQNPSATPENTKTKLKRCDVEVRMAEVVATEKVEIKLIGNF